MEDPKTYLVDLIKRANDKRRRVYVVQRSVSRSGMTRWLDLFVILDNELVRITYQASKVLGWTYDKRHDAIKVNGCGMDMHFHTVYTLSRYLYKGNGDSTDSGYILTHETI